MNLKNHSPISLFAYLVGVLWAVTNSFAEGVLIIIVAWLYSKTWHQDNTIYVLEEWIETEIKSRKRRKRK